MGEALCAAEVCGRGVGEEGGWGWWGRRGGRVAGGRGGGGVCGAAAAEGDAWEEVEGEGSLRGGCHGGGYWVRSRVL